MINDRSNALIVGCLSSVVLLRQQERQWAREKERMLEVQAATGVHWKTEVETLRRELRSVEKDRNICMVCCCWTVYVYYLPLKLCFFLFTSCRSWSKCALLSL